MRLDKRAWAVGFVLSTVTLVGCQQGPIPIVLGRHPAELTHNHPGLDPEGDTPEVDLHPHQRLETSKVIPDYRREP